MTDSSHDSEADEIAIPLPSDGHDPVLLNETLNLLDPAPGKIIVDCTLGRGGHAAAVAARLGSNGTLIALDADPRNLEFARQRLASAPCQIRFFHANFSELPHVL
jgi:16S rRNA (cytosine1402-N4)-methyltransferase